MHRRFIQLCIVSPLNNYNSALRLKMIFLLLLLMAVTAFGNGPADVCDSTACEEIGQRITKFMDEKENRCHDFFKFSCGEFLKNNEYPHNQQNTFLLNELHGRIYQQVQSMFVEEPNHDQNVYTMMKNMFNLCKDKDKVNKQGIDSLRNKLKEAGDWPIINEHWNPESWNFKDAEIKMRKEGFRHGTFIEITPIIVKGKPTQYAMEIKPGQLWGVNEPDSSTFNEYKEMMIEVAKLFSDSQDTAHQMESALNFQIELAQKIPERTGDMEGELMTLDELKSKVGWMDWVELVKGLVPDGYEITGNNQVYVLQDYLDYFNELNYLINHRKMDVANMMFWQGVEEFIDFEALPSKKTYDKRQTEEKCSVSTYMRFPLLFSYFYAKKHLPDAAREDAKKIVDHIQQELLDDVDKLEWMDPSTKSEAKKRISSLKKVVGYPDELKDVHEVEKEYEGLTMNNENYALAILGWNKWVTDKSFKVLKNEAVTKYWVKNYVWPTVTYNILDNTLTVPSGYLQPPFFSQQVPHYVNYAIFGRLIGASITRAITSQGLLNSDGNLITEGWWSQETWRGFELRKSCFLLEYQYYICMTGQPLAATHTTEINMSDQGGIKFAYNAYKKNHPDETVKLPHVPAKYTANQMFWMVGANSWCAKMIPDYVDVLMVNKGKPPPDLRVNAAYGTMKEFGYDFDCKYEDHSAEGDSNGAKQKQNDDRDHDLHQNPLNPLKRCHLW